MNHWQYSIIIEFSTSESTWYRKFIRCSDELPKSAVIQSKVGQCHLCSKYCHKICSVDNNSKRNKFCGQAEIDGPSSFNILTSPQCPVTVQNHKLSAWLNIQRHLEILLVLMFNADVIQFHEWTALVGPWCEGEVSRRTAFQSTVRPQARDNVEKHVLFFYILSDLLFSIQH